MSDHEVKSQSSCFFCYRRVIFSNFHHEPETETKQKGLRDFVKFLERKCQSLCNSSSRLQNIYKDDIHIHVCTDCNQIITSFNKVYDQIKCLELQLIGRLGHLKDVVKLADRVPSRVKEFKERCEVIDINGDVNAWKSIRKFRTNFLRTCAKLQTRQPPYLTVNNCIEPLVKPENLRGKIINNNSNDLEQSASAVSNSCPGSSLLSLWVVSLLTTLNTDNDGVIPVEIHTTKDPTFMILSCNDEDSASITSTRSQSLEYDPVAYDILLSSPISKDDPSSSAGSFNEQTSPSEVKANDDCIPHYQDFTFKEITTTLINSSSVNAIRSFKVDVTNIDNATENFNEEITTLQSIPTLNNTREQYEALTLTPAINCNDTIPPEPKRFLRSILKCSTCPLTFATQARLKIHTASCQIHVAIKHDYGGNEHEDKSGSVNLPAAEIDDELKSGSDTILSSESSTEGATDEDVKPNIVQGADKNGKRTVKRRDANYKRLPYKPACCKCDKCSKECSSQDLLDRHIKLSHLSVSSTEDVRRKPVTSDGLSLHDLVYKTKAKFRCKIKKCSELFYTEEELHIHDQLHGTFSCNVCSKKFSFAPDLAQHERLNHAAKSIQFSKSVLKKYQRKKDPRFYSFCPKCSFKTISNVKYVFHYLETHLKLQVNKPNCPICKAVFYYTKYYKILETLTSHYKTHHEKSPVEAEQIVNCEKCPAYFSHSHQLTLHMIHVHRHKRTFPCPICKKEFLSQKLARLHTLHSHRNELSQLKFVCTLDGCNVPYGTQAELDSHLRFKHTKKDPRIPCLVCHKTFMGKSALKTHAKIHDSNYIAEKIKEKNALKFVCDICGKRLKTKETFAIHGLSHSGPKSWKFECTQCSRKCMTKAKLIEHMRTHSKEKPFVCEVCGEKYAHRHNWRNHMMKKHQMEL